MADNALSYVGPQLLGVEVTRYQRIAHFRPGARFAAAPGAVWGHLLHHDIHIEPIIGTIEERIDYILNCKPKSERAVRLHHLAPYTGPISPRFARSVARAIECGYPAGADHPGPLP